jgi:hypothetical protein
LLDKLKERKIHFNHPKQTHEILSKNYLTGITEQYTEKQKEIHEEETEKRERKNV